MWDYVSEVAPWSGTKRQFYCLYDRDSSDVCSFLLHEQQLETLKRCCDLKCECAIRDWKPFSSSAGKKIQKSPWFSVIFAHSSLETLSDVEFFLHPRFKRKQIRAANRVWIWSMQLCAKVFAKWGCLKNCFIYELRRKKTWVILIFSFSSGSPGSSSSFWVHLDAENLNIENASDSCTDLYI